MNFLCSNSRIPYWAVMPCILLDTHISEQPTGSIFRGWEVNELMCKISHSRRLISSFHCCENLSCRIQCWTKKGSNMCLLHIYSNGCPSLHWTIHQDLNSAMDINTLQPHSNLNTDVHSQLCTTAEAWCKTTHTKWRKLLFLYSVLL